jgi:hypothetical protein
VRRPQAIGVGDDDDAVEAVRTVQGALSDLRAAVAAVSSSGQIDGKKAEELSKRVDELGKHVPRRVAREASTSRIWKGTCVNCQRKGN